MELEKTEANSRIYERQSMCHAYESVKSMFQEYLLLGPLDVDEGESTLFRNVGNYLAVYME
jgi:hypothetical protein